MNWFGFGFNAFGQISTTVQCASGRENSDVEHVKLHTPTLISYVNETQKTSVHLTCNSLVRASWSRRALMHLQGTGDCRVCLTGYATEGTDEHYKQSLGCKDAQISERYLTLAFTDKIQCWDLEQNKHNAPAWSMEINALPGVSGPSLKLPLVPGGYIATKPPFYRSLSPQLKAESLVLGAEHAILLSATGTVYSWGMGSHGQLGHGSLTSEEEPRAVEALWGIHISSVTTGGWHSACISAGGDLYVWGWNERGQLGLPSHALRNDQQQRSQQPALIHHDNTATCTEEQEDGKDVFISIQAFPALLDITQPCEILKVSCGSRHTAALTSTGHLYTWGWGEYGQLGHKTLLSSDEPSCVAFFREHGLRVVDIVCGPWNTFAAVVEENEVQPSV